jgi:hypothetical protein
MIDPNIASPIVNWPKISETISTLPVMGLDLNNYQRNFFAPPADWPDGSGNYGDAIQPRNSPEVVTVVSLLC